MAESAAVALRAVILEILPGLSSTGIDGRAHLKDLGADSIDRIEILSGALVRLGLSSSLTAFSDVRNIDELTDMLAALQIEQQQQRGRA